MGDVVREEQAKQAKEPIKKRELTPGKEIQAKKKETLEPNQLMSKKGGIYTVALCPDYVNLFAIKLDGGALSDKLKGHFTTRQDALAAIQQHIQG